MNHRKQNSRKQHERKFDRRGVRQLSQVVTEEMTAMQAELQALKMMVEAIIRVLDIDQATVRQMRRDTKARGEDVGNDPEPVAGEVRQLSWWRRWLAARRLRRGLERAASRAEGLYNQADALAAVKEMVVPSLSPAARLEVEVGLRGDLDEERTN